MLPDHIIDFIDKFLRRIYTTKAFGYDRFTEAEIEQNTLKNPDRIVKSIRSLPFPTDFAECLQRNSEIDTRDICDWCGWERPEALALISEFVRNRAFIRDGRIYRKTPAFIDLLSKSSFNERPKHIKEAPPKASNSEWKTNMGDMF